MMRFLIALVASIFITGSAMACPAHYGPRGTFFPWHPGPCAGGVVMPGAGWYWGNIWFSGPWHAWDYQGGRYWQHEHPDWRWHR